MRTPRDNEGYDPEDDKDKDREEEQMELVAVESRTGMCFFGYDPSKETLEIHFKSRKEGEPNKVYHYAKVPQGEYDKFAKAESKGSHFMKYIRPCFTCTRLEAKGQDNAEAAKEAATEENAAKEASGN